MTPADALAALREAHRTGTAHPVPVLRGWVRLAGVNADVRVDLGTGEATLTGERDAALRECAELRERVAGLEARLNQAIDDRMFYYQLFQDAQREVR